MVYLDPQLPGQSPFQIESLDELKDGDHVIVLGISNAKLIEEEKDATKSNDLVPAHSNDVLGTMNELNVTLSRLTNQMSRLITRLDKQDTSNIHCTYNKLKKYE